MIKITLNLENTVTIHYSRPLGDGNYELTPPPLKGEGWGLILDFYNPRASSVKTYNCLTYNNKVVILEHNGKFYYPYSSRYTGSDGGRGYSRVKIGDGKYRFKTFAWNAFWKGWWTEEIPKKDVAKYVPRSVLKAMGYKL